MQARFSREREKSPFGLKRFSLPDFSSSDILKTRHRAAFICEFEKYKFRHFLEKERPGATFSTAVLSSYLNVARKNVLHLFCLMTNH